MLLSVEAREASVEQKEAELESTEKTMERQQSELDQREADLKQQEEQLQQQQSEQMSFQEYQAALSQEDLAALKQVSGIYSKMTPKTAADVITQMSDQNRAAMSVALVTTFYGSMLANLVFGPLSKRLKTLGEKEYLQKELLIEGVLSIQNGENPRIIREKLNSFLPKEGAGKPGGGDKNAVKAATAEEVRQ